MKKTILMLPFLALFFLASAPSQAGECFSHADVPTTQSLKVVSSVNLRDKPCMETSQVIGGLTGGQMAQVIAVNDGWYKVQASETLAGWVWGDFLVDPNKVEPEPSDPETTSDPVDPADQECYQHAPVATEQTFKVKEALNLREGACAEGTRILTVLYPGEIVKAVQVDDGWYNIQRTNGTAGWVWGNHLTADLQEPLPTDAPLEPTPEEATAPPTPSDSGLTDIEGTLYQAYIEALSKVGVLKGNPDKTYQPYALLNRAEFTATIIRALLRGEENIPAGFNASCFPDVPAGQWYTEPICYAKAQGIVSGHPNGLFYPGNNIVAAEAFKILVESFDLPQKQAQATQAWYELFAQAMSDLKAIPTTLTQIDEQVTREEMAALIYAVLYKKPLPHATTFNYFPQEASQIVPAIPPSSLDLNQCVAQETEGLNMDYNLMAQEVLEAVNAERDKRNLPTLQLSDALNASSMIWAQNGQFTHTRPEGQTLDQYQATIGVKNGSAFGENLSKRLLACEASSCTGQEVVQKAQEAIALFIEQEGDPLEQRKDFDNLVSPAFTQLGFGFQIQGDSVFLVYQFSKDATGDPAVLCGNLK